MNTYFSQSGFNPDVTYHEPNFDSDSWYRSLKSVALLYQWKLIRNDTEVLRLLQLHQHWSAQREYKSDAHLLTALSTAWHMTDQRPRIWACMHIGPYALIVRTLILKGCRLAILLRSDVFDGQGKIYREQYRRSFGREPDESSLLFIRADVGNPLLKLRDAVRNGFHVVVFMDGQIALGEPGKGWAALGLHGSTLLLREGVPALAHWTGAPVRALVLTLVDGKIKWRFSKDRFVNNKADYVKVLQQVADLVQLLEPHELIQWECLPAIFDQKQLGPPDNDAQNALWLPVLAGGRRLLLDIATGRSVLVTATQFEVVSTKLKALWQVIGK